MGFRDDFEAASVRADALERDLDKATEELNQAREEFETKESELDLLRAKLRSLGVKDGFPPDASDELNRWTSGTLMIVAAVVVVLILLLTVVNDWSGYIEGDHNDLIARGRDAYIPLVTYFDTTETVVLFTMSLALAIIGVFTLLKHRWVAMATLVWATIALCFNVFTGLTLHALKGTITGSELAGAAFMTAVPVALFAFGVWSIRRLIAPWSPRPQGDEPEKNSTETKEESGS